MLGIITVLVAVLSLTFVSSTFAKYTTTGSASDSARVAKWGVTISAEAFGDDQLEADLATTENEIIAGGEADLLAPGTGIHFASIALSGTPEVAVKVTYSAELTLTGWTGEYCPLVFVINDQEYSMKGFSFTTVAEFEAKIEELIAAYSNTYEENTDLSTKAADELTVSCYWAYEGNDDVKDTALGNAGTAKVELEITCTVTQID